MEPILLIHGYSAESDGVKKSDIESIYGTLPRDLRKLYAGSTFELDISRYTSLDDGVTVDDISRAMNNALLTDYPELLNGSNTFNVIIHSTGALVVRNWVRRFSKKRSKSPIKNIIYLAGASFGSGWAHIGKGQVAKWGRMVFQGGAERGVQVLDALELGSDWTLDLQTSFLEDGQSMAADYQIREFCIIGSQADSGWFALPIRYGKEDGSDGVVRVAAGNLNFNHCVFEPSNLAQTIGWKDLQGELKKVARRADDLRPFYTLSISQPGDDGRPEIPLAIPFTCAHSGAETGVVTGEEVRPEVLALIQEALEAGPAKTDYQAVADSWRQHNDANYSKVATELGGGFLKWDHRQQYDKHAMLVFRIRDQYGRAVKNYDVFLDSGELAADFDPDAADGASIGRLFEDKHVNGKTPGIITFFMRLAAFDDKTNTWADRLSDIKTVYLEVSAVEPDTDGVVYLPLRREFSGADLASLLQPHRTTVVDVTLFRAPGPDVFRMLTT